MSEEGASASATDQPAWAFSGMTVRDLPEVLAIERRSFPNPWSGGLFLQELRAPFSRVVLARPCAVTPAPVAGYLCRWLVADEVHVLNVAVDPAERRRGLGRRLVERVIDEGRACHARLLTLEVRRGNEPACALYAATGFTEVGVRRHYYGRDEDALIMQLVLRA